jgi:drug/metabolite transporter superfamily protein YnfA
VAWKITGETEFLGQAQVRLEWERKIEKLDVGKSVDVRVPVLKPMDVDRGWGQVVLVKAETIDVRPSKMTESLQPIDPQSDLMPGVGVAGAALAFAFHEDWQLTVTATRYELQEIKRTSIERALVRMVVTRGKLTSVQAIYRMRSQRQRLEVELPQNVSFDTEPLRINGRPVTLEQVGTEKNKVAVPLVGLSPDEPFLLELRYTLSGEGSLLAGPAFPEEPAVQKVYLSVYLPKERTYLGSTGAWTDELTWWRTGIFSLAPRGIHGDEELIRWVSEGMSIDTGFLRNFETDGTHYLFSTLRPLAPPKGSLRVVTIHETVLTVLVAVMILGVGLVLTPARAEKKAVAVGAGVVALVLLAVFFPTLSRQIASGWVAAWVFIVLVVWVLWYLVVTRPRRPRGPAGGGVWTTLKGTLGPKPAPAVVKAEAPEAVQGDLPTPGPGEKTSDTPSTPEEGGKSNA